ncbi:SecY-interacting protein Syd [Planomonospora sp. ID67723]|uniref:SecY-interacting protein Syd n=1 Tax=Planomonospora sp. ID67723 TaxID=2738134 RepID=UPI0018C424F8|nr:SecY-interacting protein Syd [Planomonospora sp. ID67723]MBG0829034.1 SecY-interacting protein Syd [Planomonospora sp. ID67723]
MNNYAAALLKPSASVGGQRIGRAGGMPGCEVKTMLGELLAAWCRNGYNIVEFDPGWPSPCCTGEPDAEGMIRWLPVEMDRPEPLAAVEAAFAESGLLLHPDAAAFYGGFWSGPVESEHSGEEVMLNTVWNEAQLATTTASLVMGVRLQARSMQTITVPIGGTGSDLFFALDNTTGEILLQEVGSPPLQVVAPSLAAFLDEL